MAQNRGELFEDQFKASVPPEVEVRKLATAGPRAQSLGQISDMLKRFAQMAGQEVPGWALGLLGSSSHTPKQPYDMLLLAPAKADGERFLRWWEAYADTLETADARTLLTTHYALSREHDAASAAWKMFLSGFGGSARDQAGAPMWLPVRPMLPFALELKSTGAQKSLPFDRLQPHQEQGLLKAAAKGMVAGIVVEFPDVGAEGEVWFIAIGTWMAHQRECGRKSLSIDAARVFGHFIAVDPGRGRKHRYWKVADFLRHFGAEIPE